jgi:hypothetical protein
MGSGRATPPRAALVCLGRSPGRCAFGGVDAGEEPQRARHGGYLAAPPRASSRPTALHTHTSAKEFGGLSTRIRPRADGSPARTSSKVDVIPHCRYGRSDARSYSVPHVALHLTLPRHKERPMKTEILKATLF